MQGVISNILPAERCVVRERVGLTILGYGGKQRDAQYESDEKQIAKVPMACVSIIWCSNHRGVRVLHVRMDSLVINAQLFRWYVDILNKCELQWGCVKEALNRDGRFLLQRLGSVISFLNFQCYIDNIP